MKPPVLANSIKLFLGITLVDGCGWAWCPWHVATVVAGRLEKKKKEECVAPLALPCDGAKTPCRVGTEGGGRGQYTYTYLVGGGVDLIVVTPPGLVVGGSNGRKGDCAS